MYTINLHASRPSLPARLASARSAAERSRIVKARVAELGFEWHVFCRFHVRLGLPAPDTCEVLHGDRPWVTGYLARGLHRTDPVLRQALATCVPLLWSVDELLDTLPADDVRARRFLERLRQAGHVSGVTVAAAGSMPHARNMLSLSSRQQGGLAGDQLHAATLELFATLNEVHGFLDAAADALVPALGDQQASVLNCVRCGLKDREIAACMGLSLAGVDYHMRQLRQRFGVRSRLQLARAAASPARSFAHDQLEAVA